ncbi:MAG: HPr family phosphocarrier protein [Verrucomicrobia bacterium]|nr:HPr family phosphocarrier protein [Verrucomicrobiota bacterium]
MKGETRIVSDVHRRNQATERRNYFSEYFGRKGERGAIGPVLGRMKIARVIVRWPEGLHLRHAATLVKLGQNFQSTIRLKCGEQIADVRSIISIVALCATVGMALEIEAVGDDEQDAAQSVAQLFVE